MKPDSLVVVLPFPKDPNIMQYVKWLPVEDEETIYTVRSIEEENGYERILFNEGVIGHLPNEQEIGLYIKFVREVQPPMDLTEVLENTICQPIETY